MTEVEARDWIRTRHGATAEAKLAEFVALLLAEADRQSLIARSTFPDIWVRHIVDSAQLVDLVSSEGVWIDVGSGGGLPGTVVAILRNAPLVMVEPRRKRTEFLGAAVEALGLTHAAVVRGNLQAQTQRAAILSARAVAPLDQLFTWSAHCVSRETLFVCPRGESALADVEIARRTWQGSFHVEQSITNPKAGIVVAHDVHLR